MKMKKGLIVTTLVAVLGTTMALSGNALVKQKNVTTAVNHVVTKNNKKVEMYTLETIPNVKLKTFLTNLKAKGFAIGEIRRVDTSRVEEQQSKNIKADVDEYHAYQIFAKDSYIVKVNNQNVELYDCSNFDAEFDKHEILQFKYGALRGIAEDSTLVNDKMKCYWYNMFYKDRVMMVFKDHKDKAKLKQQFEDNTQQVKQK